MRPPGNSSPIGPPTPAITAAGTAIEKAADPKATAMPSTVYPPRAQVFAAGRAQVNVS